MVSRIQIEPNRIAWYNPATRTTLVVVHIPIILITLCLIKNALGRLFIDLKRWVDCFALARTCCQHYHLFSLLRRTIKIKDQNVFTLCNWMYSNLIKCFDYLWYMPRICFTWLLYIQSFFLFSIHRGMYTKICTLGEEPGQCTYITNDSSY